MASAFVMKLAGRTIGVQAIYPSTEKYCGSFVLSDSTEKDLEIVITPRMIAEERRITERADLQESGVIRPHSDEYLETLALCRQIAERMVDYDTILFHGSAISVDGEGYIFTAPSGTGKSTHALLWQKALGDRFAYINDDKPLICIENTKIMVYGSPWMGKHRRGENRCAELRAIGLMKREEQNRMTSTGVEEAFPFLFRQTFHPEDEGRMLHAMELVECMSQKSRVYRMECNNFQENAFQTAYQAMHGDK